MYLTNSMLYNRLCHKSMAIFVAFLCLLSSTNAQAPRNVVDTLFVIDFDSLSKSKLKQIELYCRVPVSFACQPFIIPIRLQSLNNKYPYMVWRFIGNVPVSRSKISTNARELYNSFQDWEVKQYGTNSEIPKKGIDVWIDWMNPLDFEDYHTIIHINYTYYKDY